MAASSVTVRGRASESHCGTLHSRSHCPSTIQNQIATSSATIGSILCLLDLHWPKMDAHALTLTLEASNGTLGCFPGNSAPHNGTYQQKPQKWPKHGFHFLLPSRFLWVCLAILTGILAMKTMIKMPYHHVVETVLQGLQNQFHPPSNMNLFKPTWPFLLFDT